MYYSGKLTNGYYNQTNDKTNTMVPQVHKQVRKTDRRKLLRARNKHKK